MNTEQWYPDADRADLALWAVSCSLSWFYFPFLYCMDRGEEPVGYWPNTP